MISKCSHKIVILTQIRCTQESGVNSDMKYIYICNQTKNYLFCTFIRKKTITDRHILYSLRRPGLFQNTKIGYYKFRNAKIYTSCD